MLNLKAPRDTTPAACAALALAGMGASADAATTNGLANGGLETAAAEAGQVASGWLTANAVYVDDVNLALTTAAVPEPSSDALLLAGLATVGAIARRRT